ncbi:hypothetical protein N2152v2_004005 [Parachlorella kessleri]
MNGCCLAKNDESAQAEAVPECSSSVAAAAAAPPVAAAAAAAAGRAQPVNSGEPGLRSDSLELSTADGSGSTAGFKRTAGTPAVPPSPLTVLQLSAPLLWPSWLTVALKQPTQQLATLCGAVLGAAGQQPHVPWSMRTTAWVMLLWHMGETLVAPKAIGSVEPWLLGLLPTLGLVHPSDACEASLELFLYVSFYTALAAGIFYLALRRFGPSLGSWAPLEWKPSPRWGLPLALGAGVYLALCAPGLYADLSFATRHDLLGVVDPTAVLFTTLATVVLAPLFEEVLFRGFLLRSLLRYMGQWDALLISTLIFRLEHHLDDGFFFNLVTDLPLGIIYLWTGSVWPGIILHSMWNSLCIMSNPAFDAVWQAVPVVAK